MTASVNRPGWLLLRRLVKVAVGWAVRLRSGLRVEGGARLPGRRRPLIVACNHPARVDTLYLSVALRPRFVVCGAQPRYFRNGRLRALMALGNILQVVGHDTYLEDCAALLGRGEILLIYPEMGRNPRGLGAFETWAAEVALASGAPVLPCFLHGTASSDEGPVRLVVGHEMRLEGDARTATARLREAVVALDPVRARAARHGAEVAT